MLATALFGVAACGSADEQPVDTAAVPEIVAVTVGVIPILDVAPLYLGKEKGFFRERGIDLKTKTAQGGAAIIPGVVKGEYEFGFSNVTSLMLAQGRGDPVQAVASGVASTGEPGLDFGGVVVLPDSRIKSPADLANRRIAVNSLANIGDTTVRESVRKAGGDPDSIKPVQMAFPEMYAAMQADKVDAAFMVEPFLAAAKGSGGRVVAWNFVDVAKELTIAVYFTSTEVAKQNPELVSRFVEAVNESMRFANAHPDQVRTVLDSYMKIENVILGSMTLPLWPSEINRDSVERLAELGKDDGIFSKGEPDLDRLFPAT